MNSLFKAPILVFEINMLSEKQMKFFLKEVNLIQQRHLLFFPENQKDCIKVSNINNEYSLSFQNGHQLSSIIILEIKLAFKISMPISNLQSSLTL